MINIFLYLGTFYYKYLPTYLVVALMKEIKVNVSQCDKKGLGRYLLINGLAGKRR